MNDFFTYLSRNWDQLLELTYQHILMVILGLLLALLVGIPLGIMSARNERVASVILAFANIIQVFPSLALLAVLMIMFGLGFYTVVIGLFLYSLLPIIRNTYVGLKEVDESISQVGKGVGMTPFQLLYKVQFPLSLPFIIAGIRIAVVIAIGVATLAPFIGGEGLGREIYAGINLRDPNKIYAGAIVAAILAIIADFLLGKAESRFKTEK
ncbi:osmotically activated L-carnitine/choline ABC transporter [Gracilibacillus boraciitolerans JCM 21714]|uniref:Osmotically activated L-carnitine/choline ABC transporter n=1 Tax=Gracilibacillus boraciitolerans JCM 21714 TaxID=1298598 RepID=W4VQB7_9BACI|nr:ABC transporter permease [Gracilibacillus boraciitolerans]GAE94929.1 osmotically activated L-carnitine/choline ABC transporter [Gracilibacillus boraciitolerans JCM 21714]